MILAIHANEFVSGGPNQGSLSTPKYHISCTTYGPGTAGEHQEKLQVVTSKEANFRNYIGKRNGRNLEKTKRCHLYDS